MWTVILIMSLSACAYYIIKIFADYSMYNTVTRIEVIKEQQSQLPTIFISFCFLPGFEGPIDDKVVEIQFEGITIKPEDKNFSRFFEEFTNPFAEKFFRFNSGQKTYDQVSDIFNTTTTGVWNGVVIKFNLKTPNEYDYTEVLLNFHNHSSPPHDMMSESMFKRTGSWSDFEIERVYTEQLGFQAPYNMCLKDLSLFRGNKIVIDFVTRSKRKYSQKTCFYYCSHL